ncbi:MAG: substrate-binding domain-containing protein [Vicinamibacteria bacterium]
MRPTTAAVLALALAAAPAFGAAAAQSAYRVIVNPANPASGLSKAELARIFMKKVTSWPDGRSVAVVDQERNSPARQAFSNDVHQKDADGVAAHWQVVVFSGRDVPPKILRSDEDVIAFVRSNPGAIGYVSPGAPLDGVRAVTVR